MKRWIGLAVFAFSACSVFAHASDEHRGVRWLLAEADSGAVLAGPSFEALANTPLDRFASVAQGALPQGLTGALPGNKVAAQQAALKANSEKAASGKAGNADDNAIGEPEAFATLIAGIFLMGAMARRRKTRQRF
jgi:hypothetical protein